MTVLIVVSLTAFAPASPAHGQSLSRGLLEGVVVDSTGLPLATVSIALVNTVTGQQQALRTSRTGRFSTGFISPGVYEALVERLGFQPEKVAGIIVRPGERRDITVVLTTGAPGSTGPHTSQAGLGAAIVTASADPAWLLGLSLPPLPFDGTDLSALSTISSVIGEDLAPLGLPPEFTTIMVNGVPNATRPRGYGLGTVAHALPNAAFELAHLLLIAPDVEWHPATARVMAFGKHGGTRTRFSGWGEWAGDALSGATDVAPFNALRAGGVVGGALAGDTANFLIGFEYARQVTPFAPLWSSPAAAQVAQTAMQAHNIDLSAFTETTTRRAERMSGFGAVEYQLTSDNLLTANALFTATPRYDGLSPGAPIGEYGTARDGIDIFASGQLASRFSSGTLNEIYVGFESNRSDRDQDLSLAATVPGTIIAGPGFEFGSANTLPSSYQHRALYGRQAANFARGAHLFKLGASAQLSWYDFSYNRGLGGEYVFSDTDDFAAGTGAFRHTNRPPVDEELFLRRYTFFAQDRWSVRPGLELLGGLRYSIIALPDTSSLPHDDIWLTLTGLRSNNVAKNTGELEPRFGLSWNPGGQSNWQVAASVTVDTDMIDPGDLEELWGNPGVLAGRETLNSAGAYPELPDLAVANQIGRALTMFGPKFRPPRSTTSAFAITGSIGDASLMIAAAHRRTDFLPQRRDLNLLPSEVATDQNGRLIHGTLVKQGATITAAPGSNRRFDNMDRVWAIESVGESSYTGVTLSVERRPGTGLGFFGTYTYSQTTDDWLHGRDGGDDIHVSPFAFDNSNRAWVDGRSDLDVPHRLSLGAELRLSGRFAPSIAALFRQRSGDPYTPGFRAGVDMNGDGLSRNDPAFIDSSVPGAAEVISAHDCLRSNSGRFAERNACRAPDVRALDARVSFALFRNESYSAHVVLDGLNLIGSETGVIDRAVYLVDPARDLVRDAVNGTVTVPFIANPDFGEFLVRFKPERMIRLGLRVSY
jgi:hypothetical protein